TILAQRFLDEINLEASLQHRFIIPIYETGDIDGLPYYVMPYSEGGSLRDRLNRDRKLGVEESIRIVREVAEVLEEAHRQGFVHRDIKPDNILLSAGHVMVSDFGIASAITLAGDESIDRAMPA